jgi:site-specific DNA-methyltransferase (adenine-specific)
MGFELSEEYAKKIQQRLDKTQVGDLVDGPEDPIESAPSTAKGKKRPKPFDENTDKAVIDAFESIANGHCVQYLLCDQTLNHQFVKKCLDQGLGGSAEVWNRYLVELNDQGKLPEPTQEIPQIDRDTFDAINPACEVALRMIEIDYHKPFEEILWNPNFASEFDRLAELYGAKNPTSNSLDYRLAAQEICKRSKLAAKPAAKEIEAWLSQHKKLPQLMLSENPWHLEFSGVYVLFADQDAVYVGESLNMRKQIEAIIDNQQWRNLNIDRVEFAALEGSLSQRYKVKAILAQHHRSILNYSALQATKH